MIFPFYKVLLYQPVTAVVLESHIRTVYTPPDDYYVRGYSSESPAMWNLTSSFSYQASEAVSSEL